MPMVAMTLSVILVTLVAMEKYVNIFLYALAFVFHLQILMSVLVVMIHVISMPHVSTLLVAMTVNICWVSWEIDSIVQVIRF